MTRPTLVAALLALSALSTACREPIHHDLSESDANELIVALDEAGIEASKARDERDETRWIIEVAPAERDEAWRALSERGLPRPAPEGFGAHYPTQGLIPTASEEHVLYQYATAQELRQSLLAIDGVADARVNLVIPAPPRIPTPGVERRRPRASVVIRWRAGVGEGRPDAGAIKALIAGGVDAMDPDAVSVLEHYTSARERAPVRLEQIGPISVAPGSRIVIQLVLGVMAMVIALLGSALAFILMRRARPARPAEAA